MVSLKSLHPGIINSLQSRFAYEHETKVDGYYSVMLRWAMVSHPILFFFSHNVSLPSSTVVAAAIRLAYVVHLYKGANDVLNVVPVYICSVVEISAALVALSVPSLRLFYQKCATHISSLFDDHDTKPCENK